MCIFFQILFYFRKFRYAPCHFFLFVSMGSELDQLEIINYMHRALSDQKDYVLGKLCNQSHRLLHE